MNLATGINPDLFTKYVFSPMVKSTALSNLLAVSPELAKQWHPTKNGDLKPDAVGVKSNKKVWWRCALHLEHEWEAVVASRQKSGCPHCYHELKLTSWIVGSDGKKRLEQLRDSPELFSELVALGADRDRLGSLYVGDTRTLTWKCSTCNQSWQNQLRKRAVQGQGCTYCTNQTTHRGNSLLALHPDIAAQWDYQENSHDGKLVNGPGSINPGTHDKAWWKCPHGHTWRTEIRQRVMQETGCPKCNPKVSKFELRLGCEIEAVFGLTIARGKRMYGWEADLQIPSLNVIVEVDGFPWHSPSRDPRALGRDKKKNAVFQENGHRVFRMREVRLPPIDNCVTVPFEDGANQLVACKALAMAIAEMLDMPDDLRQRALAYQESSEYIAGAEYRQLAATLHIPSVGESLAETHPHLAAQWCVDENLPLTPELVQPASKKKVWWACSNGHVWDATIGSRAILGTGCRFCSGRVASEGNSLAECFPDVAAQWDYGRNGKARPEAETPKSSKTFWWKCQLGHSWSASVNNRTSKNNGCPHCGHKLPSAEWNLEVVYPDVAKFFDLKKNAPKTPRDVMPHAGKLFWWRCQYGHKWSSTADHQSRYGARCRSCEEKKIEALNFF